MKKILACSFICCSFLARADQLNTLEDFLQKKKEAEINTILNNELKKEVMVSADENILQYSENRKFFIERIVLLGQNIPNLKKIDNLLKKYSNQDLGLNEIQDLVKKLTNIYIENGYVGARVLIPTTQNIKAKELKLQVILGNVEEIKFNNSSKNDKFKAWWTFPLEQNDILKLPDIEYGVNVINRVPQNNAVMNIYPGEFFGGSIIEVNNEKKSYLHGINIGFDNLGSKENGRYKTNINYSFGDVFNLNELFSIYGSANILDNYERKRDFNYGLDLSLPFKKLDMGLSYNAASNLSTIQGNIKELKFRGESKILSYRLGKVLLNHPKGKLKFDTILNLKSKKNYINDEKIEVSSRNSSSWKNTLSLNGRAFNSVYYTSISYQKGLKRFGVSEDLGRDSDSPVSDYDKYSTYLKLIKPFSVNNNYFSYEFSAAAQYTGDNLYSDEKYSIGNESTVRGYENSVSGNRGYFLRNQIYYTLPVESRNLRVYTGIDTGETGDKKTLNTHLLGGAVGIDYTTKYASFDLSLGVPLKKIENNKDEYLIYFSVNLFY